MGGKGTFLEVVLIYLYGVGAWWQRHPPLAALVQFQPLTPYFLGCRLVVGQ